MVTCSIIMQAAAYCESLLAQLPNDLMDFNIEDFAKVQKLNDIYSAFAAFDVGYERLVATQCTRQFDLRHSLGLAVFGQ
jgi:hypothetical protein